MHETLDERIASAFKDGATSDDVSMLIVDRGCQPLRSGGKNAAPAPWDLTPRCRQTNVQL
jgi:hypothetical protein